MAKLFGNLNLVLLVGLIARDRGDRQFHRLDRRYRQGDWPIDVLRWLHVFFGILWIGLLYYLNFVQVPTMPSIPAEQKGAITGFIAPKVFFYFR